MPKVRLYITMIGSTMSMDVKEELAKEILDKYHTCLTNGYNILWGSNFIFDITKVCSMAYDKIKAPPGEEWKRSYEDESEGEA